MRTTLPALALSLLAVACGGGEAGTAAEEPSAPRTLYERLDGIETLREIVDELLLEVAADERIGAFFAESDIVALKESMVALLCEETGGPCRYRGPGMEKAHADLAIREEHFEAMMEDLSVTLERLGVSGRERRELIGVLSAMKTDIVSR